MNSFCDIEKFSIVILNMQSRLIDRWGDEYPVSVSYAIKIINDCLCRTAKTEKYLTYRTILDIIGINDIHNEDFCRAMVFLTRSFLGLLIPKLSFVDQDETEFYIDHDTYAKAEKENRFFHPKTGEEIDNFDSMIYRYYVLNIDHLEKLK